MPADPRPCREPSFPPSSSGAHRAVQPHLVPLSHLTRVYLPRVPTPCSHPVCVITYSRRGGNTPASPGPCPPFVWGDSIVTAGLRGKAGHSGNLGHENGPAEWQPEPQVLAVCIRVEMHFTGNPHPEGRRLQDPAGCSSGTPQDAAGGPGGPRAAPPTAFWRRPPLLRNPGTWASEDPRLHTHRRKRMGPRRRDQLFLFTSEGQRYTLHLGLCPGACPPGVLSRVTHPDGCTMMCR